MSSAALAGTVTIESPADGASVNSPVHVHATYNATAKYMKLWVDHVASTVQLGTSTFDSFVNLSNGAHLIEVQAQDASTLQIFTSAANITVATLAVNPPSTSLPPGGTQQFTASDSASSSITWSATGGTITNNGLYTAGATTGNFTVTAKDSAGNTTTVPMVIAPIHTVTIESPANGSTHSSPVPVRATYASTVTAAYMKVWVDHVAGLVIHNTNTFVTSLYLTNGSHLIEVQAKDTTTSVVYTTGTTVTVTGGSSGGTVTVTPSSITLKPGATQQYTASDSAGLPVTWSATGGTITSSGLYTAGSTTGTFAVTASDSSGNKGTATVTISTSTSSGLNYTTWKNDNFRTGQQLKETVLTPSNVNSTHFGIKFSESVDGYVFAQPLYLSSLSIAGGTHNVVFVATEHDSVYAFDADGGTQFWHKNLIPAGGTTVPTGNVSSTIFPEIGITGTPVIDPSAGTIYLVTETLESSSYIFRLHALSASTGGERAGSPVVISGSGFQPKEQLQRPGLLLANGNLYIAFGSQGDNLPYHGWIFAYSPGSLAKIASWNSTSTGGEGAIWMAGSGIAADSNGDLYVMTGNGDFNGSTNFGQSFVKLSPNLTVLDHFTPYNWSALSTVDSDLGSGGPLLVPTQSTNFPHELIGCGKPPNSNVDPGGTAIWVLNRDHMGGLESGPNSGQAIQEIGPVVGGGAGNQSTDHCFMTPAFWQQNLYFIGNNDVLKQFVLSSTTGKMSTSPTAKGSFEFFFPGAQPVVSANGSSNGIVWAISYSKTTTQLVAHAASNVGTRLYVSGSLGAGAKFAVPTVVNGKVYVGTAGHLYVFGSM